MVYNHSYQRVSSTRGSNASFPPPEYISHYKNIMKYEVTITLKPSLYQHKPRDQYDLTRQALLNILEKYVECTMIAELTMEHNIHYHGMVELKDIKDKDKFLNRFRPYSKMFGRKTCNQVKFEKSYIEYMSKNLPQTECIIGDPVIRDFYGSAKCIFEYVPHEREKTELDFVDYL